MEQGLRVLLVLEELLGLLVRPGRLVLQGR